MNNDNEFRVWIGCLQCYNDGKLVGQWYDAAEAGEVTTQALHARDGIVTDADGYVKGQEIYGPHEELWVMDLDNAPAGFHHEMSPHEAQQIADALAEVEAVSGGADLYLEWVTDHYGNVPAGELADYVQDFEDAYCGTWDSFKDYAMELAEDLDLVPSDYSWPASYIDWDAAARDLAMDYSTIQIGGFVAVFRDL